jgi:macrolide transport system ATP-binding/permease protein
MEFLVQEIRDSMRSLATRPLVAVVAVLSLSLGIGINTAIYSILNRLILEPMPLRDPHRSVVVFHSGPGRSDRGTSFPAFTRYRERADIFTDVTAFSSERPLLHAEGERREQVYAEVVTASFFSAMDVLVPLGRPFEAREDGVAGEAVVLLSHDFWRRRFAANPEIIGRTIVLNDRPFTVVGVAGAGFTGVASGISVDLWMPIARWTHLIGEPERLTGEEQWVTVIGRLAPGVTIAQAEAALRLMDRHMDRNPGDETYVRDAHQALGEQAMAETLSVTGMAFAVGALVLALACANVANLLLARAAERRHEMAVRLALGISRTRLLRLWMWDGVLLCLAAGVSGLLVARWSLDLLAAFQLPILLGQAAMPTLSLRFTPDLSVFAFAFGLSLVTGVSVGFLSAVHVWKPELRSTLDTDRADGRGASGSAARGTFIALQMAVSLLLLIPCGLFVRSWANASTIDPGFAADGVLLLPISSDQQGVNVEKPPDFERILVERVKALPGVEAATVMDPVPLWYGGRFAFFAPEEPGSEGPQRVGFSRVAPDYFRTLKMALLRGRDFTSSDVSAASAPVAIVNETLARRFWPNGDALGKRIRSRKTLIEVIGIAADAKYLTLADSSRPWLYRPNDPESRPDSENPALSLAVRTSGDPAHLRAAIRREVQALVPDWPVFQFRDLREGIELQRLVPRLGATLLGVLGTFGLILAAIGVYGVVAHAVTQRTREIGIRMALGAQHRDVMLLMVRQGMTLCVAGALAGIALTLAASRVLGSLLYGIGASDPPTYVAVAAMLLAVALLACYLPARRAVRVLPSEALRH